DPEVIHVFLHHIAEKITQRRNVFYLKRSRLVDFQRVVSEGRQTQSLLDASPIGVGIRAHATCTSRSKRPKLRNELPIPLKQLFPLVGWHPLLKDPQLFWVFLYVR